MKNKFVPVSLLFLAILAHGSQSHAKNVTASSCAFNDVRASIVDAIDGDNVIIPAGQCDWGGQSLEIRKEISLSGAGSNANGTVIIRSVATSDPLIVFHCLDKPLGFSLSAIRFEGLFNPNLNNIFDRGVTTAHGCQDFLITNNTFTGFAGAGVDISDHTNTNERNRGVISENRFIENFKVGGGYGVSVSSGGRNELPIDYGSNNFVFIEDNYFAKNRHAITSGLDAAYVARYNTIEDNYPRYSAIDTHGKTFSDDRGGTKIVEIYNNIIRQNDNADYLHQTTGVINNEPGFTGVGLRGGTGVVYNNTITNYRQPITLLVELVGTASCADFTPPLEDQQPTDIHLWNNTLIDKDGNNTTEIAFGIQNECGHMFREGIEYVFTPLNNYGQYPYPHPLRSNHDLLPSTQEKDDAICFPVESKRLFNSALNCRIRVKRWSTKLRLFYKIN